MHGELSQVMFQWHVLQMYLFKPNSWQWLLTELLCCVCLLSSSWSTDADSKSPLSLCFSDAHSVHFPAARAAVRPWCAHAEPMPRLWQRTDRGVGLSWIDVSWRRLVVAHPCTLGTIKLKIIGSESPPFIDRSFRVSELLETHSRGKKCTRCHTHIQYTYRQKGTEERDRPTDLKVWKRAAERGNHRFSEDLKTSAFLQILRSIFFGVGGRAKTVALTFLDPHLSPVKATPAPFFSVVAWVQWLIYHQQREPMLFHKPRAASDLILYTHLILMWC